MVEIIKPLPEAQNFAAGVVSTSSPLVSEYIFSVTAGHEITLQMVGDTTFNSGPEKNLQKKKSDKRFVSIYDSETSWGEIITYDLLLTNQSPTLELLS